MAEFLPNFTFKPFTGVIEDVADPLSLGRVRVRAHGYHSTDTAEVSTDSLPWAHVTYNDSKRMSVPTNGEWVIGFFLDGDEAQKPIIIGTLPGIDGVEPATSKWARNDDGSSTGVSTASQYVKKTTQHIGTNITEPSNSYGAEYPHNKVIETSSGHLIEIDDTDGKERIHIYHKSGSFTEFHQDGTRVDKTEKDKYTITLGKEYIAITGDDITEVGGDYKIVGGVGGSSELKISSISGKLSFKTAASNLNDVIDSIATLLQEVITNVLTLDVITAVGPGIAGPGIITAMSIRLGEVIALKLKIATLLE